VVNWVVDDAEFESHAAALATRLAEGPTKAFAATKALWRMQAEEGVKAAKAKLYDLSMPLFETEDAQTACVMPPRRSMRASRFQRQLLPASEPGRDWISDSQ
jgi:enoyl-CoA hydratase/carnithine racemase